MGICLLSSAYSQNGKPLALMYANAPKDAPQIAFIYSNGELISETKLPARKFAPVINLPRNATKLYFLPKELEEGQKKSFSSYPSVNIPKDWKKIVLLLFEDSQNKEMPISVKALDASNSVFGPGSIYVINFSEMLVKGKIGNKEVEIKPKDRFVLKNPVNKTGFYPAVLQLYGADLKEPKRFVKDTWGYSKDNRKMLFIFPQPAPRYARYRMAPIMGL